MTGIVFARHAALRTDHLISIHTHLQYCFCMCACLHVCVWVLVCCNSALAISLLTSLIDAVAVTVRRREVGWKGERERGGACVLHLITHSSNDTCRTCSAHNSHDSTPPVCRCPTPLSAQRNISSDQTHSHKKCAMVVRVCVVIVNQQVTPFVTHDERPTTDRNFFCSLTRSSTLLSSSSHFLHSSSGLIDGIFRIGSSEVCSRSSERGSNTWWPWCRCDSSCLLLSEREHCRRGQRLSRKSERSAETISSATSFTGIY